MSLKDDWPWQDSYIRLFLWTCIAIGVTGTIFGVAMAGATGLWFLTAIPLGFFWRLLYGSVGDRVTTLEEQYRNQPGHVETGLLVVGPIQAPGVVVKRDRSMVLHQITGQPLEIPIDELEVYRFGRMLPGKYLWGKRAIIFEPQNGRKLAFGVRTAAAESWLESLPKSKRFTP